MKELTRREIQNGSLEILKKIDKICNDLNLEYFLAYGTLIGAIRHHGFIPWDDDVDIWMPRKEYQRFIDFCVNNPDELEPYVLMSQYNKKDYPHGIGRLVDPRFTLDVKNEIPYGLGLFVDIYPLDGAGDTEKEYKKRKKVASRYSSLCFLSSRVSLEKGTTRGLKKILLKFPAFIYAKLRGTRYFLNKLEEISKEKSYENCKFIGCMVWGTDGIRAIFPKEWFEDWVTVEFEASYFRVPKDYEKILRRLYGDYMKLPPKEKQKGHHFYKAYRKY